MAGRKEDAVLRQKQRYRRRNYLINKPLQLKYAFIVVWLMLITVMAVVVVVYTTSWNLLLEEMAAPDFPAIPGLPPVHELLGRVNQQLALRMSVTAVLCVLVGLLLGVLFLHRIAGPCYRISRTLKEMAKGVLPTGRVTLREKDYLKGLAGDLNMVLELQRRERDESRELLGALQGSVEKALAEVRKAGASPAVAELERALDRIRKSGKGGDA